MGLGYANPNPPNMPEGCDRTQHRLSAFSSAVPLVSRCSACSQRLRRGASSLCSQIFVHPRGRRYRPPHLTPKGPVERILPETGWQRLEPRWLPSISQLSLSLAPYLAPMRSKIKQHVRVYRGFACGPSSCGFASFACGFGGLTLAARRYMAQDEGQISSLLSKCKPWS